MRAFVFPGQGAQAIGMGKALADAYPAAKAVFDEVDAALGESLSSLIWEGDIAELTLTRNAQPALMATSLAVMRALEAEGIAIGAASYVAGHSLGEYSALAAAGGVLYALNYPSIDPLMGVMPGLKAFVAAILGGIGSLPGAALGALILGTAETFVGGSAYSTYKDAIAFSLLIVIMLFRPAGLLGRFTVEKV